MTRSASRAQGATALRSDRRGATIVEFALVLPVLLVLMMGLAELAYQAYVQAVLTGAMQKAGRDSTIQGAPRITATIDGRVIALVRDVAPSATYSSSRKSYARFGYIQPEPFTDSDGDGIREAGECYSDVNGNARWDADPGATGQGGAGDAVVYKMVVSYPRLFPVVGLLGWSGTAMISATTVLKNQPYASQNVNSVATICT